MWNAFALECFCVWCIKGFHKCFTTALKFKKRMQMLYYIWGKIKKYILFLWLLWVILCNQMHPSWRLAHMVWLMNGHGASGCVPSCYSPCRELCMRPAASPHCWSAPLSWGQRGPDREGKVGRPPVDMAADTPHRTWNRRESITASILPRWEGELKRKHAWWQTYSSNSIKNQVDCKEQCLWDTLWMLKERICATENVPSVIVIK